MVKSATRPAPIRRSGRSRGTLALAAICSLAALASCRPLTTGGVGGQSGAGQSVASPSSVVPATSAAPATTPSTTSGPTLTPTPTPTPSRVASASAVASPATTAAAPTADVAASTSARATAADSSSATPEKTPTAPAQQVAGQGVRGAVDLSTLPRIPWEGGPAYWSKFPAAHKAGWSRPDFLPVAIWWGSISTDDEVQWGKQNGFNTYVQIDPNTDAKLFERNGVFYIGQSPAHPSWKGSPSWVGTFLDDEVDGRFQPAEGLAHLNRIKAANANSGRFTYANYTYMLVDQWFDKQAARQYVDLADLTSIDSYWYSIPFCDFDNWHTDYFIFGDIKRETCRTSSMYGRLVDGLRQTDAADGQLGMAWNFIELNNPILPQYEGGKGPIKPAQIKGAAMASIIHEARGLIYYNQDYMSCPTGNLVGDSFNGKKCARENVLAAGQVNTFLQSLAPVINTQSYRWDFGKGLDTMLKVHDGSAYVFAMVDKGENPGRRTFTLPEGLRGRQISVVGEKRTITPNADGTFSDDFAAEYSYHVYRIS